MISEILLTWVLPVISKRCRSRFWSESSWSLIESISSQIEEQILSEYNLRSFTTMVWCKMTLLGGKSQFEHFWASFGPTDQNSLNCSAKSYLGQKVKSQLSKVVPRRKLKIWSFEAPNPPSKIDFLSSSLYIVQNSDVNLVGLCMWVVLILMVGFAILIHSVECQISHP